MKTKIIIIDHQDSFTYNLVQLFVLADAVVEVKSYCEIPTIDFSIYDGIVLSPGPGLPSDYPNSIEIIDQWKEKTPILGICMGLQLIVSYFGGKLYNLPTVNHGKQVEIFIQEHSTIYNGIKHPLRVGLYHSWAMDTTVPIASIQITSTLNDNTVMSIQHTHFNIQAVQYHPESFMTEQGDLLIKNWLNGLHLLRNCNHTKVD